jgi:nicotinamidase-related amidase
MTSVLLLVDVQKNMLEPPEPVPDADTVAEEIKDLLGRAQSAGTTVVHIRNNGRGRGPGRSRGARLGTCSRGRP